MNFLSLFLLFSLTSSSTSTSNLVDKDLRVFRRQFNEFRSDSLLKVDQSYFEIYSAILSRISQFKKPYKNLRKLWEHTCDNYDAENLDRNVNSMLILVCEKTRNLLIGAENMDSLGLKEFFSSGLLVSSAPMTYIQNMFDAIEVEIEKIVEVYYENVTCVSPFLQQISPIFKPFVDDVVNLTKVTIQKIDKTFHHCGKFQDVAVGYVSDFIRKFKYCEKGRFLNECVRKFLVKEVLCANNCGRLFSSIRSAIFTITEAVKKTQKTYKKSLYDIGDVKFYTDGAFEILRTKIKKQCLITKKTNQEENAIKRSPFS